MTGRAENRDQDEPRRLNSGLVYRDRLSPRDRTDTLLEFYLRRYPRPGEAEWRERITSGRVRVDGVVVTDTTHPLAEARRLEYHRPPWVEPPAPERFDLLHEDDAILAVGKPAGLPTLPGGLFRERTLIALVRAARPEWRDASPAHRLDRGTSGIVLFTRTSEAASAIGAALDRGEDAGASVDGDNQPAGAEQSCDAASDSIQKSYLGLVHGDWQTRAPEGSDDGRDADWCAIDTLIGLHDELTHGDEDDDDQPARKQRGGIWAANGRDARPARTLVRRIAADPTAGTTLVELCLLTGRPHQLRIHCAAAGYPLVGEPFFLPGGDFRRGAGEDAPRPGAPGFLLHAWRLSFTHPTTGDRVNVEAPPPDWAAALLS